VSLLSAAERLAAIDRSAVILDTQSCLHARDQLATCEACFELCPSKAIRPGKPPTLETEKCQTCLACLPVCPVGAYSADDAVPSLLNCAVRLEDGPLELLCELHPSAEVGVVAGSVGIRVRGCLAGLGSGAYLALVALRIQRIIFRTEACAECPWCGLVSHILAQIARTEHLLSAWRLDGVLSLITELSEGQERPLWEATNPPLSRRDLFRVAAKQGQVTIARTMSTDHSSGNRPGRDYLRIAGAAMHLTEIEPVANLSLAGVGFCSLTASEDCTACNACTRACPTAALKLGINEDKTYYWLKFSPLACIGCGICARVCEPQALAIDYAPTFVQVFGPKEPAILQEGDLGRCERCNSLFAARSGVRLCPVCEFRRKNPFGSKMPPGIKLRSECSTVEVKNDR